MDRTVETTDQKTETKPISSAALQADAFSGLPAQPLPFDAANARDIGPTNPDSIIKVTVMVRSKASEKEMDETLARIAAGKEKPLSEKEFAARFGADPAAMAHVLKFAGQNKLKVDQADYSSGQVQIEGKARDISQAFHVQLEDYQKGSQKFRTHIAPAGTLIPHQLSNDIEGVFGLDTKPLAVPQFTLLNRDNPGKDEVPIQSYMPNEIADIYKFPSESKGAGQSVGIVELGGGLDLKDNAEYYKEHALKEPQLQLLGVDGARNQPGDPADDEVALDTQIIGAIAPDARQQLIFAPNTFQGFLDSITRATFPDKQEPQNSAISISWGAPEMAWDDSTLHNVDLALKKAALKGISVFAASGDTGAWTDPAEGFYDPFFPASDPYVTATGGTHLDRSGKEVAWNDGNNPIGQALATGGGISWDFPVPDFQKNIKMPADDNATGRVGRGVPDIAADASQKTGYIVRFHGKDQIMGGTSCVAPLYSALVLRTNSILGHPVGYLNPFLYKNADTPGMFKDITEGNNNGYNAGPGWDATTGLGVINGDVFLKTLQSRKG